MRSQIIMAESWDINPFHADAEEPYIYQDSALVNPFFQVGTGNDSLLATQVGLHGGGRKFSSAELEELFRDRIYQRICEAFPEAVAAAGWTVKVDDEKLEADDRTKLQNDLAAYTAQIGNPEEYGMVPEDQELGGLEQLFYTAQVWANIYRGSAIVIVAEDGKKPSEPLNHENIKTIRSLELLTSDQIVPDLSENWINPMQPQHYQLYPTNVEIADKEASPLLKVLKEHGKFHASRIIRFDAMASCPPDLMRRNGGWGDSLIEATFEAYQQYALPVRSMANAIKDFSLFVMKIKNLDRMKTGEGNEAIKARFRLMMQSLSIMGGVPLDSEGEDLTYASRQFNGLADMTDVLRDIFIGVTGIPHDRLFGESPSGLGATGESEEKNWAKSVDMYRKTRWEHKLRRVYRLIFEAKDGPTKGKLPENWSIQFGTIYEETEADKATARSTQANIDNQYIQMGVLTIDEVRMSRFGKESFSFETELDQKAWEEKKKAEEEAAAAEQQGAYDPYAAFSDLDAEPGAETEPAPVEEPPPKEQVVQDSLLADHHRWELAQFDCRLDSISVHNPYRAQAELEARERFAADSCVPYVRAWVDKRSRELQRRNGGGKLALEVRQ